MQNKAGILGGIRKQSTSDEWVYRVDLLCDNHVKNHELCRNDNERLMSEECSVIEFIQNKKITRLLFSYLKAKVYNSKIKEPSLPT